MQIHVDFLLRLIIIFAVAVIVVVVVLVSLLVGRVPTLRETKILIYSICKSKSMLFGAREESLFHIAHLPVEVAAVVSSTAHLMNIFQAVSYSLPVHTTQQRRCPIKPIAMFCICRMPRTHAQVFVAAVTFESKITCAVRLCWPSCPLFYGINWITEMNRRCTVDEYINIDLM